MKSIQQPCNLLLQGFVLFAILFASFTLEVDAKATKSVSVELKANWPQTPLPLEIGEFLASEDEELFWKFLDNLGKIRGNTEEEQYTHAFEVATELLSSVQTDLLQYSLAIRYFSPRVQMYRQVYDLQLDELEEATRKQLENQSGAWALFNNQIYSSPSALLEAIRKASSPSAPTIHEFDHVHPSSAPVKTASSIVILYATIGTQPFLDFHSQLTQHFLSQDNTAYVLRHLVPSVGEENAMNLAGYGVELDIKSLEYKAVDDSKVEGGKNEVADITEEDLTEDVQGFVFGKLQQRKPEYSSELAAFKASLLANDVQFEELKQWQLKDIGYQAAQRITAASDPLMLMKEISQNFPTYAVSLSKTKLDPAIKSQIETNRAVEPGRSMVVINGRMVDPQTADPFQLFSILREELNKIDSLQKANVPKDSAFQILSTPSEKSSDVYRIIEDPAPEGESQTSAIVYINDLETDPPYAGWPHSVGEIFRRVWPGSFRFIGKNLFTHVAFIDPSTFEGIYTGFLMEHLMTQQAPIRFALVMVTHGYKESLNPDNFQVNDAVKVVRLFHYINSMYGPREAMAIFKYLRQHSRSSDQIIRNIAQGLVNLRLDMNHIENVVLSNDYQEKYDHFAKRANQFAVEKGIKRTPVQFMNGAMLNPDISIEEMQGTIINSYFFQTHILQQLVRSTEINNDMDIYATLLSRPGTMPRYSDVIVPSQQNPLQYLSLSSESFQAVLNGLEYFPHRYGKQKKTFSDDLDEVRPISDHVIVDWRSPSGVRLAYYGLKYMMQAPTDTRLSLVFNAPNPQPSDTLLAQSMLAALQSQTSTKSLRFMHNFFEHLHNENEKGQYSDWYYIHGAKTVEFDRETINRIAAESELNMEKFKEAFESLSGGSEVTALLQANKQYVHHMTTALKLPTALQNGLVANGRVVLVQTRRLDEATANPSDNYGSILFAHTDFEFLSNFEFNKRSKKIQETLSQAKFENVEAEAITPAFMSDIIMKATSVIGLDEQHNVEKIIIPSDLWTSFQIRSRNSSENWSNFRIYAIFNPISTAAQRFVPILQSLLDLFDIQLYVILNPSEVGTLPLSHFYTYVLPSKVSFKPDTGAVASPVALLPNLPTSRLLTMKLDTPEAWFVTPTVARYDLDNIKLEDLNANNENVLYAQLELQSIVVEGNCLDVTGVKSVRGGIPPRGLEVVLTDQFAENGDRKPVQTDTIVMSNLGYFQLKSNPGVWKLELRKQTKSSDLYDIIGEMDRKLAHKTIVMSDFNGKFEMLRVRKKAGREGEELLSEENASWNLSGFFGGKKEEETIHVFSVATGHLYERFLKIMMLSVVKQTNSPVKFWLLANYLSPKFKEAIPHMAKQYNFEYELVTYKWPAWLHKQTEKQRIIWGYKILFLDVLFPLNVKKVIYVDADQVVRTDLKELWNMDLEGAPYGYTPFCSDRNEMDGFRFWKQGFWMNHLIGKPYHISALYVVDLVQFRKQGAGDTLRATYAQLAQDPNSLANLDQDLPNYLQHVVKIKSLPQEWLWCETWCSDESKPKAKTIDLCNNPLTKTPKLDNAVRILAEWPDLDNEIKTFEKNWSQQANHPAETNDQHAKHKQVILESTREILL